MFKEERIRSIGESRASKRHEAICRQAVWGVGLVLLLCNFAEALAQPKSRSSQASEFLEWLGKTLKESLSSGPPPSLDDLKPIKEAWCKLRPDDCSRFPQDAAQVRKFGGIYSFPYLSASAMFYNHPKRQAVLLPPRAQDGIKKAVTRLHQQDWNSSKIAAWLLPVSSHHYSSMEAKDDCYIYRSENGYVKIQFEGNTFSGERVSVKVVSEELPKKSEGVDKDLRLRIDQPLPSHSLCSHFDKFKAYWEGSFDL